MKKLISAIGGMLTLLAAASNANADSNGAAMNSCKPHDWIRFTAAVEAMDAAALAEMAREPELRFCEFAETIVVLLCDMDPLACVEPAAPPPPPPPSTEPDLPILRITAPGAHIGVENDSDRGGNGGGGEGGGEASAATDGNGGGNDGGGRDPNDSLR